MSNDWNFWFSVITAAAAVIAIYLSFYQIRLSNKQQLFDKRMEIYMIVKGLIRLYTLETTIS